MNYFTIILLFISFSHVYGQNEPNIPDKWKKNQFDYEVTLTKINFYTVDSIIPYTLVQEPDGSYYFVDGHRFTKDSVTINYLMKFQAHVESLDTMIPKLIFVKNDSILKLTDYTDNFSFKNGGILNTYEHDFQFKPYIHEINYSFLFQEAGLLRRDKFENDSIIRLTKYETEPYDDKNHRLLIYQTTVSFKEIFKVSYSINSVNNLIKNESITIPLTKKESNKLKVQFAKSASEKIKFSTKTNQYNPFLVEYKKEDIEFIIERSDGADSDERNLNNHDYHSNFQGFVALINDYGSLSIDKIEKRQAKMKK